MNGMANIQTSRGSTTSGVCVTRRAHSFAVADQVEQAFDDQGRHLGGGSVPTYEWAFIYLFFSCLLLSWSSSSCFSRYLIMGGQQLVPT